MYTAAKRGGNGGRETEKVRERERRQLLGSNKHGIIIMKVVPVGRNERSASYPPEEVACVY